MKTMNQSKTVYVVLVSSWTVFCIYYYNVFGLAPPSKRRAIPINSKTHSNEHVYIKESKYQTAYQNITENVLMDTPGCIIPDIKIKFKTPKYKSIPSCGKRAIFIEKIDDYNIQFLIDLKIMNTYTATSKFKCCYQYASRSTIAGREDTKLSYSTCIPFQNGTTAKMKHEVINVICDSEKSSKRVYEDVYAIVKKITNIYSPNHIDEEKRWNVLVIGMDTMSRLRFLGTMPRTLEYFRRHHWLDFRGYQKVGFNTFPNLMAILTGKNMSTVYKECAKGMSYCNHLMIWSRFREAGYVTAYGEDYLRLPDTFGRNNGFRMPPTHHYLRPFFLTGEQKQGPLLCTKKIPSAYQLLDYTTDFAQTYANESFFGFFWLNSFSHNDGDDPALVDQKMVDFFDKLTMSGVMEKTILMFVSDHGVRYGPTRIPVESYYAERLPMLFMWIPSAFRNTYVENYSNLINNQYRLTTPYDFHVTLWDIIIKADSKVKVIEPEACPQCPSWFSEISQQRTCADAGISKKWCSCHVMSKVDQNEDGAKHSMHIAVEHIKNITKSVKTKPCTKCTDHSLQKITRIHSYVDSDKEYYVVAFILSPGNVGYEATVEKDGDNYEIQEPTETITSYSTHGNCVINPYDLKYCVCRKSSCG